MKENNPLVYLLYAPYTRKRNRREDPLTVDPHYAEMQKELIYTVLRWAIQNHLVRTSGPLEDQKLIPVIEENIASFSYLLNIFNFQHLVYKSKLDDFIQMISDNSSVVPLTKITQLHIALLSLYDPNFLHYHINHIYSAYAAIALPDADHSWSEIHRLHPYMWVILTLQLAIKYFTDVVI